MPGVSGGQLRISSKNPCRVATTGNIADLAAGAPNVVDGKTVLVSSRVLVWKQSTASQNGYYQVVTPGTGSDGAWVRTGDFVDAVDNHIKAGVSCYVQEGDLYKGHTFILTTEGNIVVGTTALTFFQGFPQRFFAHKDWPEGTAQAGNELDYKLWWPVPTRILAVKVRMGTVNTQGTYTLAVTNENTTNSMLAGATFNMNDLSANTITDVGLTSTDSDKKVPANTDVTITLNSSSGSFDGSKIYLSVYVEETA